jgi:hypothetical protein
MRNTEHAEGHFENFTSIAAGADPNNANQPLNPGQTNAVETNPKDLNAVETNPNDLNAVETNPKDLNAVETNPNDLNAVETNPKDLNAVETNPKDLNAVETNPNDLNAVETNPKDLNAVETNPKDLNAVETNPKDLNAVETNPKDLKAVQAMKTAKQSGVIEFMEQEENERTLCMFVCTLAHSSLIHSAILIAQSNGRLPSQRVENKSEERREEKFHWEKEGRHVNECSE